MRYSAKLAQRIVDLIRQDTYTIAEVCVQVDITPRTFFRWKKDNEEFRQMLEDAEEERMQDFVCVAKNSLRRMLTGYDVKEVKTKTVPDKNGNPIVKEQHTKKIHIQPNVTAVIFTLTNGDPEHWKNRQNTELTGAGGKDLFGDMTSDELKDAIKEAERKLN